MDTSSFLPRERGFDLAYQESYRSAGEKLKTANPAEVCRRSGAERLNAHTIGLTFLGRPVQLNLALTEFASAGELTMRDKLVILHYLVTASGRPLCGEAITFKELPEGISYYPTFAKRALKPLLEAFAHEPERLAESARSLGGSEVKIGDDAAVVPALPRVPITIVLWRGDAEFAPEGSILFDRAVTGYLPTEDITVLCEITAWRLVRLAP
jgi:hypothetical protein